MHDINKEFVYIYLSDRETKFENRVRKRGGNGILKKDEIRVLIMFRVCEKPNFSFSGLFFF